MRALLYVWIYHTIVYSYICMSVHQNMYKSVTKESVTAVFSKLGIISAFIVEHFINNRFWYDIIDLAGARHILTAILAPSVFPISSFSFGQRDAFPGWLSSLKRITITIFLGLSLGLSIRSALILDYYASMRTHMNEYRQWSPSIMDFYQL